MDDLTPQQEKKLRRIAKIVDDGPLAIAEHIFELEEKFDEVVKDIKDTAPDINKVLESIKGKNGEDGDDYIITEDDKKEIATEVETMVDKDSIAQKTMELIPLQEISDKITAGIEIPTKVVEKVIEKTEVIHETPIVTEIVKEIAVKDTPEQIVEKLESLQEEEKLPIEAIKDLREELDELRRLRGTTRSFGGVSPMAVKSSITNIDISSQLNGVLKTFSLGQSVHSIMGVHSSSFPHIFRPTVDYTNTGNTITFTSEIDETITLATGQTVILTVVT